MTTPTDILAALAAVAERKQAGKVAQDSGRRNTCPRCQQRSNDGMLCADCMRRTRKALRDVVDWWPDLWLTITRQARLAGVAEGHALHATRPLAFDYWAADLANEIKAGLVGWARMTIEDCGAPMPRDLISALCDHLTTWLPQMRRHEAVVEMADELIGWPAKMKAAVDYPDERSKIPVGPCPQDEDGKPCGGTVHAILFTDEHQSPVMRCGKCKHEWVAFQWARAGKLMLDRMTKGETA